MLWRDLLPILDALAPLCDAEPWDNVGLLVGSPEAAVQRILCCIDLTHAVLAEAVARDCDAVLAYHPPLFKAIQTISFDSVVGQACRRGIALYSPHTALDVAAGGTNDVLAAALGLLDSAPLRPSHGADNVHKLVFFVPPERNDAVCAAVWAAGAGHLGAYSHCSYQVAGHGTFLPEAGSHPTVGTQGRLERTAEVRVEMLVPEAKLGAVLAALRAAHPYEEPAFDVVPLRAAPARQGIGRMGTLPQPVPLGALAERLRQGLGLTHVMVSGDAQAPLRRLAVCAGAGGELMDAALAQGAELFVTGELRHHDALRAQARGLSLVATLHSNSERAALRPLAERLAARAPELSVLVSAKDCDPFRFVAAVR